MRQFILQGRHSTYTNAQGGGNRPIEEKRHMNEDSSWSIRGMPAVLMDAIDQHSIAAFNKQTDSFFYEHWNKGDSTITQNDIINKQMGFPTNEVVQELLYAGSHRKIDNALKRANTPISILRRIASATGDERLPFHSLPDYQLIEVAFFTLTYLKLFSRYGHAIRAHFKNNTGEDLEHKIGYITDFETNKSKLLNAIRDQVTGHYRNKGEIYTPIDITNMIAANMLDFRKTFFDTSEMLAIGGVQQIEIKGYLTNKKKLRVYKKGQMGDATDFETCTYLEIELEFIIKDWFGVDEEDVYKKGNATRVDREGLAALWILQHQRGYRPFINVFTYKKQISTTF